MKSYIRPLFASAILAMGACMCFSSCSNESEELFQEETPVVQKALKSVTYSITVNKTTRNTLAENNKTMLFQEGDQLFVSHIVEDDDDMNIVYMGSMHLVSGAGTTSATFEGKVYFTGENEPKVGDELDVILVGQNTKMGKLVPMSDLDPRFPEDVLVPDPNDDEDHDAHAISKDLKSCVEEYSSIMTESTYGNTSMELNQSMAFLNFDIALPAAEEGMSAAVSISYGEFFVENTKCPLTVTKDSQNKPHLTFTAAIDADNDVDLSNANLTITLGGGSPQTIQFPSTVAKLQPNKVYNVVK